MNWYKTLPLNVNNYAEIKTFKDGVSITNRKNFGSEITNTSKEIVGKKDTILNLMGRLPDMLRSLARYGHSIPFSRADYRVLDKDNKKTLEWIMHGASNPIDLQAILKMFKYKYSCREQWECSDYEGRSGCIVKWMEPNKNSADMRIQFPSMREDLNNEYYAYAENLDTHEIVDIYRIAFGLSMLSRYYPDFWVRCLDSHCIAAKAIEHFVFVMIRKFPVLSLRHLTGEDDVISNQRPPWLISLRG